MMHCKRDPLTGDDIFKIVVYFYILSFIVDFIVKMNR